MGCLMAFLAFMGCWMAFMAFMGCWMAFMAFMGCWMAFMAFMGCWMAFIASAGTNWFAAVINAILLFALLGFDSGIDCLVSILVSIAGVDRRDRKGTWMRSTIMGLGLAGDTWDWDSKRLPTSGKASSLGNSSQAGGSCLLSSGGGVLRFSGASVGVSATGACASVFASATVPVHELGIAIAAMAAFAGEEVEHRRSTGAGELSRGSSGRVSLGN